MTLKEKNKNQLTVKLKLSIDIYSQNSEPKDSNNPKLLLAGHLQLPK